MFRKQFTFVSEKFYSVTQVPGSWQHQAEANIYSIQEKYSQFSCPGYTFWQIFQSQKQSGNPWGTAIYFILYRRNFTTINSFQNCRFTGRNAGGNIETFGRAISSPVRIGLSQISKRGLVDVRFSSVARNIEQEDYVGHFRLVPFLRCAHRYRK